MSFKVLSIMDDFFCSEVKPRLSDFVRIGDFSFLLFGVAGDVQSTSAALKDMPSSCMVLEASQILLVWWLLLSHD